MRVLCYPLGADPAASVQLLGASTRFHAYTGSQVSRHSNSGTQDDLTIPSTHQAVCNGVIQTPSLCYRTSAPPVIWVCNTIFPRSLCLCLHACQLLTYPSSVVWRLAVCEVYHHCYVVPHVLIIVHCDLHAILTYLSPLLKSGLTCKREWQLHMPCCCLSRATLQPSASKH